MRIQIALRNIFRNVRRTLLTIFMIAGGIAAIVVFRGFCYHLIAKIQETAINSQFSHIQIGAIKAWNINPEDSPKDRLMSLPADTLGKIAGWPEVAYVSSRMSFYGLLAGGEHSVSAHGLAYDPVREEKMQASIKIIKGRSLEKPYEIIMGSGLHKLLGVPVGTPLNLLAYTYDGSVNALDAEIVGIFQTEMAELDNSTFYTSLDTAKKLLDTDLADRTIVQLKNTEDTLRVQAQINSLLPPELQTRRWSDLSTIFNQVVDYFRVQNAIIEWILMMLVLLSIVNTVGMSVSERTGEIGTVRALGDTQSEVVKQFLLEGLLIGILGGIVGCVLSVLLAHLVTSLQIPVVVPNASVPQLIEVALLPRAFIDSFVITCAVSIVASFFPALRASRIPIVEALRHNI